MTVRLLRDLQPAFYVTHLNHGVGIYTGLEKINVGGQLQEAIRLVYKDNDVLYVSINSLHKVSKYVGKDGKPPKINKIGSDPWETTKRKAKRQDKSHCHRPDTIICPTKSRQRICLRTRYLFANRTRSLFYLRRYTRPSASYSKRKKRYGSILSNG